MRNSAGLLPLAVAAALEQAERDCDLDFIVAEMPRAIDQSLDGSRRVAEIVRAMKEFSHPDSADKTAANLNRAIESIAKDVGMAAKILQLANSAFIGSRGQVSSLIQAVSLIGTETVRTLVLSVHVFSSCDNPEVAAFLPAPWDHSIAVGALAQRVAASRGCPKAAVEESFAAGLLHDVGKVIFLSEMAGKYRKILGTNPGAILASELEVVW